MRTTVLSVVAVAALAGTADAQYRVRGRVVVAQPLYVVPVEPVVVERVYVTPAAARVAVIPVATPGYVYPTSLPGYVGPYVSPELTIGRGYNFYPGYGYSTYPAYRYWR